MLFGIWLGLVEDRVSGMEDEVKEIISIKQGEQEHRLQGIWDMIKRPNLKIFVVKGAEI